MAKHGALYYHASDLNDEARDNWEQIFGPAKDVSKKLKWTLKFNQGKTIKKYKENYDDVFSKKRQQKAKRS